MTGKLDKLVRQEWFNEKRATLNLPVKFKHIQKTLRNCAGSVSGARLLQQRDLGIPKRRFIFPGNPGFLVWEFLVLAFLGKLSPWDS